MCGKFKDVIGTDLATLNTSQIYSDMSVFIFKVFDCQKSLMCLLANEANLLLLMRVFH